MVHAAENWSSKGGRGGGGLKAEYMPLKAVLAVIVL